jgi:hypothetical protein
VLVARIVVDVDGYGAQLRDFGLEGGEGVVVLPGGRVVVSWVDLWRIGGRVTYLSRS